MTNAFQRGSSSALVFVRTEWVVFVIHFPSKQAIAIHYNKLEICGTPILAMEFLFIPTRESSLFLKKSNTNFNLRGYKLKASFRFPIFFHVKSDCFANLTVNDRIRVQVY